MNKKTNVSDVAKMPAKSITEKIESKSNCLILGAGLMQKPAILAAKELGYKAVVIDADEKAVSIPYADEFKKIDLKAKDEILEFARELQSNGGLSAVFTAGTDFSASVSYVCEKLDLPAHSYQAALNASIKTQMRACFESKGVPSPAFFKVTVNDGIINCDGFEYKLNSNTSEINSKNDEINLFLKKILTKMDFPLVVKPVDNMGGRGCRMVRSKEEFSSAIKNATESSRSGTIIIESYMEGPEFSIDALIFDGQMVITGFAERHIKYPPYFIEVGHTMPAELPQKMHDELISVFALGVKALGLSCGVAKADIKYTKNGPMIGEIAGRLSGGYMSGWTYPYASDVNLTKQALLIASGKTPAEIVQKRVKVEFNPGENCLKNCGGSPDCAFVLQKPYELFEVPCVRTSAERAWISIPGTVEYIENITEYTDKAVFDVLPRATVSLGCSVDFPRNNVQKCGNIISVSHQRQIAVSAAQDAVSNIFITLKPDDERTQKFLENHFESDEDKFPPSAFETILAQLKPSDFDSFSGTIPANQKIENFIPEVLKKSEYKDIRDWNYNTILETAQKFDVLRPKHKELDSNKFWRAVLRGGIQAAVYVSDSQN